MLRFSHVMLRQTYSTHFRWKGDHGGKLQLFFPANYVEEISNNTQEDTRRQVKIRVQVNQSAPRLK